MDSIVEKRYRLLVAAMADGFHPENFGKDYISLPAGYTVETYDEIVDAAHEAGLDVFQIAFEVLELGREEPCDCDCHGVILQFKRHGLLLLPDGITPCC